MSLRIALRRRAWITTSAYTPLSLASISSQYHIHNCYFFRLQVDWCANNLSLNLDRSVDTILKYKIKSYSRTNMNIFARYFTLYLLMKWLLHVQTKYRSPMAWFDLWINHGKKQNHGSALVILFCPKLSSFIMFPCLLLSFIFHMTNQIT